MITAAFFTVFFTTLLRFAEDQVFEEEHPNQVDPTEHETDDDRENHTDDVPQGALFKDRADADDDLRHPVHERDEQEQELYQSR